MLTDFLLGNLRLMKISKRNLGHWIAAVLFLVLSVGCSTAQIPKNAGETAVVPKASEPGGSPEDVVALYFELSKHDDVSQIKKLVTDAPRSYVEYSFRKATGSSTNRESIRVDRLPGQSLIIRYLTYNLPESIRKNAIEIEEFEEIKSTADDSRVVVYVKPKQTNIPRHKIEFLLHLSADGWKIFQEIDDPKENDFP